MDSLLDAVDDGGMKSLCHRSKFDYMLETPKRQNPQGLALTDNQQATCESRKPSETICRTSRKGKDIVRTYE